MRTIADMMGVPESERVAAARAGDAVIGRSDPSFGDPADPIGTITAPATTCTRSAPSSPSTAGRTRATTCSPTS